MDHFENIISKLQNYVEELSSLYRENPERLRSYIEEKMGINFENMLLNESYPDMVTNIAYDLCSYIGLSEEKYKQVKKYIMSLINKIRSEIKRPDRPHLEGYLREALSQIYEILSRIHECFGDEISSTRAKVEALKFRGITLKIQGRYHKAIDLFEKAYKLLNRIAGKISDEKTKSAINRDLTYLLALKYEAQAQLYLQGGESEKAIEFFKKASEKYKQTNDDKSSLWTQGFAYALESLINAVKGNMNKSMKLMSHVYSNIYPKIEDSIMKMFDQRRVTVDRLFGATMISIVSRIAFNYWRIMGAAYELLLNIYYEAQGYTLLPRTLTINNKSLEVDLNAIKYDENKLIHVIGECKITLRENDIRKIAYKINTLSRYIKENPVLCPKGYNYKLHAVVVANFNASKIDKDKAKKILHTEIKEEHELNILDILELENRIKKILRELSLYPIIKKT